jgi:hypothetical protein
LGSHVWDEHVVSHARDEAYRSSYVRQHTSAYVSIRQHTSAYVSIRTHARDEAYRRASTYVR